jgi:hypothetical protein
VLADAAWPLVTGTDVAGAVSSSAGVVDNDDDDDKTAHSESEEMQSTLSEC